MSGDKTFEMHLLEDRHGEEVAALKKKLQWFAENQELLDRDAGRLKAATAEIQQLKEQVRLRSHILFILSFDLPSVKSTSSYPPHIIAYQRPR